MSKKAIIIFTILLLAIVAVIVIYGYNLKSEPQNQILTDSSDNASNVNSDIIVAGPSIKVTPESYDLGIVKYGEVAEHTFKVKNLGNEPLEILRLATSCGCTKASISEDNKIIAPGQSVDILVTFDPAVHEDDSDLGSVKRIVYIKTNDPENPEAEVEINAYVVKEEQLKTIQVTAKKWSFNPNPIRVKQGDVVRLEITSLDVTHGFALPDFNIDEVIEPGKKVVVDFLADKKGKFSFFCSVPCGLGHSRMRGQLVVE